MFAAIDLSETFDYIATNDPAIDPASVRSGYTETLDTSTLSFVDGMKPTIFKLKPVSDRDYTWANDRNVKTDPASMDVVVNPFGLASDMCRCGLKDIVHDDGIKLQFDAHGRLTDKSMDMLRRWGVVDEIGNAVMTLNHTDKKK